MKLAFQAARKYPKECQSARMDIDQRVRNAVAEWHNTEYFSFIFSATGILLSPITSIAWKNKITGFDLFPIVLKTHGNQRIGIVGASD